MTYKIILIFKLKNHKLGFSHIAKDNDNYILFIDKRKKIKA